MQDMHTRRRVPGAIGQINSINRVISLAEDGPQRLGQLDQIVASVEAEPRQRIVGWQIREQRRDLLGSDRIGILLRAEPTHAQGRRPTFPREADLGDPGIRPAGDNGLACRMP